METLYTAPNTTQKNGKIERKFATLYGKIRSVLNAAGFSAFLFSRLWSYAAKCVIPLENTIVDSSTMTASEKFTGSTPKWFKHLHTFGEIGVTYDNQKIKASWIIEVILVCLLAIQKIMHPMLCVL
jgi:hypothetical protein